MKMRRSCWIMLFAATACACKGQAGTGARPDAASAAAAASSARAAPQPPLSIPKPPNGIFPPGGADAILAQGAPAIVRLVTPGAVPRVPLRYAFAAATVRSENSLTLRTKAAGMAMEMPPIGMTYEYTVGQGASGQWPVTATLVSTSVGTGVGLFKMLGKMIGPQLATLRGMKFTFQVDDRGRVTDMKSAMGAKAPPQVEQILTMMKSSMQSMMLVAPAEPIGKGGTWQVVTRLPDAGTDLIQVMDCTLTDRRDAAVTIDMTVQQYAAKPEMASNGRATPITSFSSVGKTHAETELSAIAPRKGTFHQDNDVAMTGQTVASTADITFQRH
jgi:hypothetical protein